MRSAHWQWEGKTLGTEELTMNTFLAYIPMSTWNNCCVKGVNKSRFVYMLMLVFYILPKRSEAIPPHYHQFHLNMHAHKAVSIQTLLALPLYGVHAFAWNFRGMRNFLRVSLAVCVYPSKIQIASIAFFYSVHMTK